MDTFALIAASAMTIVLLLFVPGGRRVVLSCFRVDLALVTLMPGIRTAIGMVVALYVAQLTGPNAWGTPVALGVLLTTLSDFSEPYNERWRVMLMTAFATSGTVLLGGLVSADPVLHLVTALVLATLVGYAGAIGPRSGLIALFGLALFSLYSGSPIGVGAAGLQAEWYLVGGLISTGVACIAWPFTRYAPTRRKIAAAYRQLSVALGDPHWSAADVRVVVAIGVARASIINSGANGATREWLEGLLEPVERVRIWVWPLNGVPVDQENEDAADKVRRFARVLTLQIERYLVFGCSASRLRKAHADMERACAEHNSQFTHSVARPLFEALTRSVSLLAKPWPIGRRASAAVGVSSVFKGLEGLTLHFKWSDLQARHALKLGLTYTVATALALGPLNSLLDQHAFWVPLTVAWVCKPDVAGSVSRFSMRLCGTVFGVLIGALLLHVITTPIWLMAITGLGGFVMCASLFANYSLTVIGVTVLVLSLSAATGHYSEELADARMFATVLGCGLVLLSSYIVPVRSGTAAPLRLVRMSAHLRAALASSGQQGAQAMDRGRLAAAQGDRLAATVALAAADSEPIAPWERRAVGLELRSLAKLLNRLEHIGARLALFDLTADSESKLWAEREAIEGELNAIDESLIQFNAV